MTLHELIQSHRSDLLCLQPEELSVYVLASLNKSTADKDRYAVNPYNFGQRFAAHDVEVRHALMEAWGYLEREGLIAPDGNANFAFVTRRGAKIRQEVDWQSMRRARMLPREALHPETARRVWGPFLRGEYETAVFEGFKGVEIAVRSASGLPVDMVGEALMREAFKLKTGVLTDATAPRAEQQALQHLFAGAFGYFRNPPGHRDVGLNRPEEAIEMVMLASHLMRVVDNRRPK